MPLIIWFLLIVVMGILYGKVMNRIGSYMTTLFSYIKNHMKSKK